MQPDMPYFIILLYLMPDYFTNLEEIAATQWVNIFNLGHPIWPCQKTIYCQTIKDHNEKTSIENYRHVRIFESGKVFKFFWIVSSA